MTTATLSSAVLRALRDIAAGHLTGWTSPQTRDMHSPNGRGTCREPTQ